MREIIYNKDNLKEEEITEIKRKVKILLVNSNNEILLVYSNHEYHFPGGKVEKNENLEETVIRELKEETGIKLNISKLDHFILSKGYYKDWPTIGKNRKIEIYYYEIKTDELANPYNMKLTENEQKGNFKIKYIPLDDIENILIENVKKYGDPHSITKEMLPVIKIYKERK